jgi:hypothetical protein
MSDQQKQPEEKDLQYESLLKSNFKQQKLSAWRPVPTIVSTTITFVSFGIIFIVIGIIILLSSNSIIEYEQKYNNCSQINGKCSIEIQIDQEMKAPIMVYYQLTNFYQNHRRYVKSKSNEQLSGKVLLESQVKSDCEPIVLNKDLPNGTVSLNGKALDPNKVAHPCGLIARSFFNDYFQLFKKDISNKTEIKISDKDIAWSADKEMKFKKPEKTDDYNPDDNLWIDPTNERFIVWMRPAGLPNFRKLWGRIETDLQTGVYILEVDYKYQINFGGDRVFVLSTVNSFGGKNSFLGIAYIVVGGICLVMAVLFFFGYKTHSKVS